MQQDGLRAVVQGVADDDGGRSGAPRLCAEETVAQVPRGLFDRFALAFRSAPHVAAAGDERDAERSAELRDERAVALRFFARPKPVIEVRGGDRSARSQSRSRLSRTSSAVESGPPETPTTTDSPCAKHVPLRG